MPNDAELIAGLRARDEAAMNALYERYSGIVYAVALRVLSETSLAEDVLQDVFLQLWRNPGAFDASRGSLGAWLAVISRHRAIDVLRKRRPQTDLEEVVVSFNAPLAEDASRKQIVERAREAMQQMSPEQRSALEMAFFQGLTQQMGKIQHFARFEKSLALVQQVRNTGIFKSARERRHHFRVAHQHRDIAKTGAAAFQLQ